MHNSHETSSPAVLSTLAAGIAAAIFLSASVLLTSDSAFAQSPAPQQPSQSQACQCDDDTAKRDKLWPKPNFAELKASLEPGDEIATLEALQLTLSELGDGQTYVWHRAHGRLSGAFQPTASFKDAAGKVCRHVVMLLAAGNYSRKTEGVACRLATGRWQLEG